MTTDAYARARDTLEVALPGLIELSHRIYQNPELGYEEVQAAGWLADALEAAIAERLRTRIERLKCKSEKGQRLSVTMSLAVTELRPGETSEAFISRVDGCLYDAKRSGRNCVVVHPAHRAA